MGGVRLLCIIIGAEDENENADRADDRAAIEEGDGTTQYDSTTIGNMGNTRTTTRNRNRNRCRNPAVCRIPTIGASVRHTLLVPSSSSSSVWWWILLSFWLWSGRRFLLVVTAVLGALLVADGVARVVVALLYVGCFRFLILVVDW